MHKLAVMPQRQLYMLVKHQIKMNKYFLTFIFIVATYPTELLSQTLIANETCQRNDLKTFLDTIINMDETKAIQFLESQNFVSLPSRWNLMKWFVHCPIPKNTYGIEYGEYVIFTNEGIQYTTNNKLTFEECKLELDNYKIEEANGYFVYKIGNITYLFYPIQRLVGFNQYSISIKKI